MTQQTSLQDRFHPIRTTLPSCIQLPSVGEHNFQLKPQFINTFPKFHGWESEDAYFFIGEFGKVYLMMKIPHLKDLTKKWFYSLVAGSITSWDGFFKIFLKKLYPIHKTAFIRKNIMQFK